MSTPAAAPTSSRFVRIVGLIGVALTFIAAKGHLPGIGNDAASYLAIAERFARDGHLGYFLEPDLALWPPGWPVVLGAFRWAFDISPATTALWINAWCLIPLAMEAHWLLRRLTSNQRIVRAGVVISVLGPATLSQSYMAQTEITFTLLVLGSFIALIRWCETSRAAWLVIAVLAQWAAFMDRYVGIVAIGACALWLVFERLSGHRGGARFGRAVGFFLASCVVPGSWILRNRAVTGTEFGVRDTPLAGVKANAVDAATSVGQFIHGFSRYAPMEGIGRLASLLLAAGVGVFAIACLRRAVARRDTAPDSWRRSGTGLGDLLGHPAGLLVIYAGAHWAYMIYSASTIAFDPVNTRYLTPMFIPALIAGLVVVDRGAFARLTPAGTGGDGLTRMASIGLAALLVLQVLMGVVRVSASYWTDDAQTYNSPTALDVRRSPVLDELPADCDDVASNFPELISLAGIESQRSPRKTKFASSDELNELDELAARVDAGATECLIWVDDDRFATPAYQWQLDELTDRFRLTTIASDDDVALHLVEGRD